MSMLRRLANAAERLAGIKVVRIASEHEARLADLAPEMRLTIDESRRYSMTSVERLAALCMAVEFTVAHKVPGAFVECGVWKGGSSMAAAYTYNRLQKNDVDLFLFDTFDGMSQPGANDIETASGRPAEQLLATHSRDAEVWAYAPLAEVQRNLERTGYPPERLHLVKGRVEDTLPREAPAEISVLRLDTDWYESTKHELIHLFPRLSRNAILIIDDYGAWAGARRAVDEYFSAMNMKPFLHRIDETGRLYVNSGDHLGK